MTLKQLFEWFIIIGDDFPKLFAEDELNEDVDYEWMLDTLEERGFIKDIEEIDKLNLWVAYKDDIKDALIIDQDEYKELKELNGSKKEQL